MIQQILRRAAVYATAILIAPAVACADSSEIEHLCTLRYPSMTQYFVWKDCLKTETAREAEEAGKRQAEELRRIGEEAARPCIAGDISRMESLAAKVKAAINVSSSLEEARAGLKLIIGQGGAVQIPKDNIKERVLVNSIDTKCDSQFHFLINVREGLDGKLRWVRVWAENAPDGYPKGLHSEFSSDFDAAREQERWRAEEIRRNQEIDAVLAKAAREREESRQKFLRSVAISNVKMKCFSDDSCSMRTIEFAVTNVSQQPVKGIGFGWMFLPPKATECPASLGTKENKYLLVLQPGEKALQTITVLDAPENRDAKYCLSVTELGVFYPR